MVCVWSSVARTIEMSMKSLTSECDSLCLPVQADVTDENHVPILEGKGVPCLLLLELTVGEPVQGTLTSSFLI